ncbi:hypothetical protein AKJ16_DCAP05893 [Drosera capensis]
MREMAGEYWRGGGQSRNSDWGLRVETEERSTSFVGSDLSKWMISIGILATLWF